MTPQEFQQQVRRDAQAAGMNSAMADILARGVGMDPAEPGELRSAREFFAKACARASSRAVAPARPKLMDAADVARAVWAHRGDA